MTERNQCNKETPNLTVSALDDIVVTGEHRLLHIIAAGEDLEWQELEAY